ncbi:MAG: PIN domain-containing protein [Chloroflexi bacterium]|nr:PIN domain-containing protein [Chloroflexota bacterium]
MAPKIKALFDLNVILDVLQQSEPYYETSAQLLAHAETGRMRGFIAPHSLTMLFYLVEKDQSSAHAKVAITSLLQILEVATIDQSTIEQALSLPYRDFEDAVQIMAAVQCKAEYLVTRNVKDFQPAPLSVIQPGELLALI